MPTIYILSKNKKNIIFSCKNIITFLQPLETAANCIGMFAYRDFFDLIISSLTIL